MLLIKLDEKAYIASRTGVNTIY